MNDNQNLGRMAQDEALARDLRNMGPQKPKGPGFFRRLWTALKNALKALLGQSAG